jgi:hypothetical protein
MSTNVAATARNVRPVARRALVRPGPRGLATLSLALLSSAAFAASAGAATVGLGTADSFSVLGGSAVTNTGPSVLEDDLGVAPGTAISGFPPGLVGGAVHANDAVAQQAKSDLVTAYDDAAGRSSTATVSGDLAGRTLVGGVYTSATSLGLSGDLVLDAQGDPNAVFVFQAGSTLTTASGSRVLLIGGAQACNVFWQVGSSATLGSATAFTGTILALTSISLTTAATVDGRALARNGAVTLDTNVFTSSACVVTRGGPDTPGGTGTPGDGTGTPGGGTGTPGGGTGTPGAPGGGPGSPTGSGRGSPRGTDRGSTRGTGRGTPRGTRRGTPLLTTTITRRVTQIGCESALLGGRVRPGAAASRWFFEYGTSRGYGSRTAVGSLRRGTRAIVVHARANGLVSGSRYHYRLVSVRPGGQRTRGADRTFGTSAQRDCRSTAEVLPPIAPPGFTG